MQHHLHSLRDLRIHSAGVALGMCHFAMAMAATKERSVVERRQFVKNARQFFHVYLARKREALQTQRGEQPDYYVPEAQPAAPAQPSYLPGALLARQAG